ncbi:hypothetical protein CCACVL1_28244 [Corchorus capsularis]|uniref:Uncharacterized protein n=1 Tax=Corchorus capsularis TaxID=210143 RepID=A0A1R3G756_COCAP|nr:hypothetical protein CCACVL1_28244 [Corchorus capsularis]
MEGFEENMKPRWNRTNAGVKTPESRGCEEVEVWKLSARDLCEIARNSICQSGFSHLAKYEDLIHLESAWKTIPINNLVEKTFVSLAKDMIRQILEVGFDLSYVGRHKSHALNGMDPPHPFTNVNSLNVVPLFPFPTFQISIFRSLSHPSPKTLFLKSLSKNSMATSNMKQTRDLGLSYPPLNCYAICSSVVVARLEHFFMLDEASNALQELLPKASAVYPGLRSWNFAGARAGLRAMPPLTPHGSLPLLGCLDTFLGEKS